MNIPAIWHFPDAMNRGAGAGDFPVVIVDLYVPPTQSAGVAFNVQIGAVVLDATMKLRTAPLAELEVVDPSMAQAMAVAQARLQPR